MKQLDLYDRAERPPKKVLSDGGGLDSFTMLLDAIARGEKPDIVAFVDVGNGSPDHDSTDPAEWPGTYRHLREHTIPLCAANGIEFEWIDSTRYPVRDARSLFAWMDARKAIPVAGPTRICTTIAKVERFERWMRDRFGRDQVEVWIGFEAGEESRAANDPNAGVDFAQRLNRFPLMERTLCRCRCEALVRAAGYPVPRKSACTFCPYGTKADYKALARELPATFDEIVRLEAQKPLTKNGAQLSIRNFRTIKNPDGTKTYKPTMLPVYIQQPERKSASEPCGVCGAPEKATKAMGCDWL